jgi:hypothetical protein
VNAHGNFCHLEGGSGLSFAVSRRSRMPRLLFFLAHIAVLFLATTDRGHAITAAAEDPQSEFARKFDTFEWVPLFTDPKHPMWAVMDSNTANAAFLLPPGKTLQRSRLNFAFPLGDNFEVSATIKTDPRKLESLIFRFVVGVRPFGEIAPYPNSADWALATISSRPRIGTEITIADAHPRMYHYQKVAPLQPESTIVMRVQYDLVTMIVNGVPVLDSKPLPARPPERPETLFGFDLPPRVSSAVTEIKVRKLPDPIRLTEQIIPGR